MNWKLNATLYFSRIRFHKRTNSFRSRCLGQCDPREKSRMQTDKCVRVAFNYSAANRPSTWTLKRKKKKKKRSERKKKGKNPTSILTTFHDTNLKKKKKSPFIPSTLPKLRSRISSRWTQGHSRSVDVPGLHARLSTLCKAAVCNVVFLVSCTAQRHTDLPSSGQTAATLWVTF